MPRLSMDYSAEELSAMMKCPLVGDGRVMLYAVSQIDKATEGDLTFVADKKYEQFLETTAASCIIVHKNTTLKPREKQAFLLTEDPYRFYVDLYHSIVADSTLSIGFIHPAAHVEPSAAIDSSVFISFGCYIGPHCIIKEGVKIHPNAVLYGHLEIGEHTEIHSGAVLHENTVVGSNCIIHAGAAIGSDGFGYLPNKDGSYKKIPHIGGVVIGDDVEIGANSTIDKGVISNTRIENGVKIDNLVHIAHNVVVGENSAVAAQTGIAGSCVVGKRNRLAGQTGLAGHLTLADDVTLLAQSGVGKDIRTPGAYLGSPVKEHKRALKLEGAIRMLPELFKEIQELKTAIEQLKKLNTID